jgi:flotillin
MLSSILSIAVPAVIVLFVIIIAVTGYIKAPPDTAYIISGIKKKPRVIIGKAGIKIPFFERLDKLILKQLSVDIKTNGYIPTEDFIGVDIDAIAKVRVLTEADITAEIDNEGNVKFLPGVDNKKGTKIITRRMVDAALRNFLNLDERRIRDQLTESLQGNMREIIGTQTLRKLCQDRKAFGDEVQAKAQKDMNALGIWIESCNIQKLLDENGLINALGQDNMSQIQKDAAIAKANADKDVAVEKANAAMVANDAKVAAEAEIAAKQAELAQKKASLKKEVDTQNAQANAASAIEAENQRKLQEVASTNANIAKAEREAELKQKQIELKEYELDALVRKQADADKYAAEKEAEAGLVSRQKAAEAKAYEVEMEAKAAKTKADASRYAKEQEAAGIAAVGLAKADATEKMAEAQKKMGEASILEMYLEALPEIVANAAAPLTNVDKITLYGEGNQAKLVGDVMKTSNQILEGLKESTGIDISQIIAGYVGGKAAQ